MSLDLFRLPRPEFTRQAESLIADLVWGSLPEGTAGARAFLLPKLDSPDPSYVGTSGTLPAAFDAIGGGSLFLEEGDEPRRVMEAIFSALYAPRAPGSRLGDALVMVNPDFAAFQNLRGFTNKRQPPSYRRIFDRVARLGGAAAEGEVAAAYLAAYADRAAVSQNATGFLESGLSAFCNEAFAAHTPGATWPGATAGAYLDLGADNPLTLEPWLDETPFRWFWDKWTKLHRNPWRDVLPARRFADWQSCIARTGLAMAYLHEARVLCLMREAVARRAAGEDKASAASAFAFHLGPVRRPIPLGRLYSPSTAPATKACWPWLENVVRQGLSFLAAAKQAASESDRLPPIDWDAGPSPGEAFTAWLGGLSPDDARRLLEDAQASPTDGSNLLEFIKHLLKPLEDRADETGFGERADLYGLLKTGGQHNKTWFEPGPEWLVPMVSLAGQPQPGGQATLKAVRADLARLGLECDRAVLVSYLEACGLTTDSPDADDGLVVRSGF
jgi:hypothetical protein